MEEVDTSKHPCKTEISAQKGKSPVRENNRNDLFGVGPLSSGIYQSKADNWVCAQKSQTRVIPSGDRDWP